MEQQAASYDDQPVNNNSLFQGDNPFDFRQDLIRARLPGLGGPPADACAPSSTPTTSSTRSGRSSPRTSPRSRRTAAGPDATSSSPTPGRSSRTSSTSSRPTPPGTASGSRRRATPGSARPTASRSRSSSRAAAASRTASPTRPSAATQTSSAPRSRSSRRPRTSSSATTSPGSRAPTRLKFGGLVVRNRKDQNGRSRYAGQVDFNTAGNSRTTGNAFADALLGQLPHLHRGAIGPRGLLPLLAARGLRLRQLARVAQAEPGGRGALRVAPADLHPGQQHGQLRSRALRPGPGHDREPQRDPRARLRRPLQRNDPGG